MIDVVPKLSMAPLRYVRLKVRVEARAGQARVEMHGPTGLVRSSEFPVDALVTLIEWKTIAEGPGEYVVVLQTSGRCTAHDKLTVAGGDGP